ncbi:MAG: MarR family transcriptional regulator [Phreatobacter sp.]|uniref:MarR family winged helix-turn-helix transcriptional regulator n=1 Tax=Phreatobacter sp. TaxID=1966341 RepID=UPI001A42857C|nr:MarR family transcriptional regulator [Phreatobacter sp.]MBL8571903.1 MarR family transcriptional regulator [Phreatobacter sp.]
MSKMENSTGAPEIGQGKRGEDGHIGYLLQQAAGVFRLRMARALADLDVTPPQFAVLTMLSAYPGLSNAELARLALLTPQTLSVIVANLLRSSAVVRHAHPVHGRILNLELSDAGRQLLARCRDRVHAIEAELVAETPPDDIGAVRRWLVRVARQGGGTLEEG